MDRYFEEKGDHAHTQAKEYKCTFLIACSRLGVLGGTKPERQVAHQHSLNKGILP